MRNCSVRAYTELQTVVRLYLMLPLALVGIAANGVNVLVFLNRRMRRCVVNWFLLALSVCDLCLLLCSILFVSMPVVTARDGVHSLLLIKLQVYFFRFGYPVGITAQMASVYYTTFVCLHRYIAVCHPLRARQFTTKRSAKVTIATAAIFSVLFNMCRFWETGVKPCVSSRYDGAILTQITISGLGANHVYRIVYSTVGYTIIKLIAPFFILLVLTTLMIRTMCQSKQLHAQQHSNVSMNASCSRIDSQSATHFDQHEPPHTYEQTATHHLMTTALTLSQYGSQLQRTNGGMSANQLCRSMTDLNVEPAEFLLPRASSVKAASASRSHNVSRSPSTATYKQSRQPAGVRKARTTSREGRVTTMLLTIVGVFLLCNSPLFLSNISEILLRYQPRLQRTALAYCFRVSIEVGNLLVSFNSASTIVIYVAFSSKYNEALVAVFGCFWKKTTPPAVHYVAATTINNNEGGECIIRSTRIMNSERSPLLSNNMKL